MASDRFDRWLLVVVDGPSESRDGDQTGAIRTIVRAVFGDAVASGLQIKHWRQLKWSPLRGQEGRRIRPHWLKAVHYARLGHETTAYGTILLMDNDGAARDPADALRDAVAVDPELRARTAIGTAKEMLEAWLLADPDLCLPAARKHRCPDTLWGDEQDPWSNHPKRVLKRLVLEPRRLTFAAATDVWDPTRARTFSPSLETFMGEVEALARRQGVL